jgi:hypothetical protein
MAYNDESPHYAGVWCLHSHHIQPYVSWGKSNHPYSSQSMIETSMRFQIQKTIDILLWQCQALFIETKIMELLPVMKP